MKAIKIIVFSIISGIATYQCMIGQTAFSPIINTLGSACCFITIGMWINE